MSPPATLESVRQYYGEVLSTTADLKTSACCTSETLPRNIRDIISNIDDEVLDRFYGCGSPIPDAVEGATVLDLGCGTGRDVFVVSKLVGPQGRAIGLDMTEEQLAVARRHQDSQAERFGFRVANTDFVQGYIEDLKSAGIEDASVDVVISNCVINLSPDKRAVFNEIFRVLKPGGELLFADVFADRRIPADVASDPVVYGECLGGALYFEDFRRMMVDLGCPDFRVIASSPIEVDDAELAKRIGPIGFTSVTVRAFKLGDLLEDQCEDYGQVVTYGGAIPNSRHVFELDPDHRFEAGRPERVCGNSAAMIQNTRFSRFFDVIGDRSKHFGLFDCSPYGAAAKDEGAGSKGSCC